MARVTVEDSLEKIPNRFDLILVASKRARDLLMTADEPKVPWDNDKSTVVALREIAEGLTDESVLYTHPSVVAEDSYSFDITQTGEMHVEHDQSISVTDGQGSYQAEVSEQQPALDEQALAAAFAALDQQHQADKPADSQEDQAA